MGGSQGARAINEALLAALAAHPEAGQNVEFLWATGPGHFESVSARLKQINVGWVKPVAVHQRDAFGARGG